VTHVAEYVREWRTELLREAGFDRELAGELARDERVDLHEALELVDRGCPPDLAARILAPL
jgi:Glu-tRNA(Gln) amidotransferase subunit E-like FAD-binding protein